MDTLSHGLWGYAALRWRGPKSARIGFVMGAGPDVTYFTASVLHLLRTTSWSELANATRYPPQIWRKDGPPLPDELLFAYEHFYVYTHSLILWGIAAGFYYLLRKKIPWILFPWALHILMDIPTHERYLTPFLFPLSDFVVNGVSWGRPFIFFPNLLALAVSFVLIYKMCKKHEGPWREQLDGIW